MEIQCVCETVQILWNKSNLNTSELKPWALIFIQVLQIFWVCEEGDYSPRGTQKGHVLMGISREHVAMNVRDQSAEGH